jgi:hypothetical protein
MENLRRFFSIFEVRGGNLFLNVVWLKYDHFFFIAKLIICVMWTIASKIFNFNKKKMKCSLPPVKA